jgi:hypothetical protein
MFRFALVFALAAAAYGGPLCVPGASLASYEALGPAGCVIDPAIPLSAGGFSYSVLSSSGAGVVTPDTNIFVTPLILGPLDFRIEFTSGAFDVSGSDFVDYQIGFTWDPPVIRSADDLNDPVVPPGLAQVATTLCLGAAFTGSSCSTSTAALTVSDNGISPVLTQSVSFAEVPILGVLNDLDLSGGGSGSAEITGFSNDISLAPEPAALPMAAGGLLILIRRRRRLV